MYTFTQKVSTLKNVLPPFRWFLIALIGLFIGSSLYWINSDAFKNWKKEQDRVQLAQLLQQYQRKPILPEDIKKIPKKDRPDLALEQDIMMTLDPKLGYVPHERKLKALKTVRNRVAKSPIPDVNWEERGPNNIAGRTRALMFDPNDSDNQKVWAGSVSGGLWYNNNITSNTSTWQRVDDFWSNIAIGSIAYDPTNPQIFYVGTGELWAGNDERSPSEGVRGAGIWKSTDGGATWAHLASTSSTAYQYVNKIVVTNTGRVLAATVNGLRASDNGGANWTNRSNGTFSDIEIAANDDLYAGRLNGIVQKSTNNGTSWSTVHSNSGGARVELAAAPSNADVVYAIGSNGTTVAWVKKTINGGNNWTTLTIPKYLEQNCTSSSSDFTRNQAYYNLSLAVHPLDENLVLMGGIDVNRTTDGGNSWSTRSYWTGGCRTYVHADQHAAVFRPGEGNENHAIVGTDGGVFYSTDVGNATDNNTFFSQRNNGYNVTQFYACAIAPEADRDYFLAGAQDNGSNRFNSPGINSTFEVTGGDGGYCHIDQDNSNIQLTSYVYNIFYRSTNGGNNFNNIADEESGLFISPSDYDDDANILYSSANQNSLFRVRTVGSTNPGSITVSGGLGGGVATAIKASPYSDHVLFVGTWTGNVYRVRNANTTAVSTSMDPTNDLPNGWISSVDVGDSEDHLLITLSNYGINSVWETQNGGASWANKEGNLPDMPVRWGMFNPGNRQQVLLATEMGVWSTSNIDVNSPEWDPTNTGLGHVKCTMLQHRASDNLIAVATYGRGLFTAHLGDFCAAPTKLSVTDIIEDQAVLKWNSTVDALSYQLRYKEVIADDWIEVTNILDTTTTITDLAECTFYTSEVRAVCGVHTTPYSKSIDFIANCDQLIYCTMEGNANFEWIEEVSFHNINNNSGSNDGYGNYQNLSTNIKLGQTYPITLSPGYSGVNYQERWKVWIDFNQSSTFDANELVVMPSETSNTPITEHIIIPTDAVLGTTVMRVVMTADDDVNDPCYEEDEFYGEIEDYAVVITTSCSFPTNLMVNNITGTEATLQWDTEPSATAYRVRYRIVGSENWESTVSVPAQTDNLKLINLMACATYEWEIESVCDIENSTSIAAENFDTECGGSTVQLKVNLEGPFVETQMTTNLLNVILANQPYNVAPWRYEGVESLSTMPENIVDWILVQATDENYTVVETKAALLAQDGRVWDVTGTEGVRFETLTEDQSYHFIIRHRNHLDIVSKMLLPINNMMPHDFTDFNNVLDGVGQLTALPNGAYAMAAGDLNSDGIISVSDFNYLQTELAKSNLYSDADIDFDRNVLTSDFNKYQLNAAKIGVGIIRY